MSNFPVERARIRLSESIEAVDPNANIDAAELCWVDPTCIDANACGVTPLKDFWVANFDGWQEDDKWFPAQDGLITVRKLVSRYRRILRDGIDELGRPMSVFEKYIALLEAVESVLSAAEETGAHFCIAVSDK